MSEIQRILAHYDGVLNGDAWHGDPLWQVLDGITAQQAAARAAPSVHTTWQIVMHMIFWENVAAQRLAGLRAGLVEELNFPATPAVNEGHWRQTLDRFRASNRAFRQALATLDPGKLNELSAAGKRTFHGEAHGLIEHHVYHLGQIALLKKILI
jgi:hypothetical protein